MSANYDRWKLVQEVLWQADRVAFIGNMGANTYTINSDAVLDLRRAIHALYQFDEAPPAPGRPKTDWAAHLISQAKLESE